MLVKDSILFEHSLGVHLITHTYINIYINMYGLIMGCTLDVCLCENFFIMYTLSASYMRYIVFTMQNQWTELVWFHFQIGSFYFYYLKLKKGIYFIHFYKNINYFIFKTYYHFMSFHISVIFIFELPNTLQLFMQKIIK